MISKGAVQEYKILIHSLRSKICIFHQDLNLSRVTVVVVATSY